MGHGISRFPCFDLNLLRFAAFTGPREQANYPICRKRISPMSLRQSSSEIYVGLQYISISCNSLGCSLLLLYPIFSDPWYYGTLNALGAKMYGFIFGKSLIHLESLLKYCLTLDWGG